MKYIMLIDSGTTNSRIKLVEQYSTKVKDSVKVEAGVRNTAINGTNEELKKAVKQGMEKLLKDNNIQKQDINYILASGMITSNLGLHEVPHQEAPADAEKLAAAMERCSLEEMLFIPCYFIPGLKSIKELKGRKEVLDVMRGEETEAIGLMEVMQLSGNGTLMLPGSHTKWIRANGQGELLWSSTSISGELLKAVQSRTVLSDSLPETLITKLDEHALWEGFSAAEKMGVNRALFQIRLQHLSGETEENERANFLAGVIFHSDITALKEMHQQHDGWVLVGGSFPLKDAAASLIKRALPNVEVIEASSDEVEQGALRGPLLIAENKEELST